MTSEVQVGEDTAWPNEDEEFKGQLEAHNRRKGIGRLLLRLAWAVEVCAIAIGLFIAISQVITYSDNSSLGTMLNTIISATPFFMVAIVEGTKIPFVAAFYNTPSLFWRYFFGFILIFLALITFESALNGFERQYSNMSQSIDSVKDEFVKINNTIKDLEQERLRTSTLTEESIGEAFTAQRDVANQMAQDASAPYRELIGSARTKIAQQTSVDILKNRIKGKQQEMIAERESFDRAISTINDQISMASASLLQFNQGRINELQQGIDADEAKLRGLNREQQNELRDVKGFGTKAAQRRDINARYQADRSNLANRIREKQKDITELSQLAFDSPRVKELDEDKQDIITSYNALRTRLDREIESIHDDIIKITSSTKQQVDEEIASYQTVLDDIETDRKLQDLQAERKFKNELIQLENQTEAIARIDEQITLANTERTRLKAEINDRVHQNQVYRIAKKWYGVEEMAELSDKQTTRVAFLWFGSLAFLVACTGIFLALASEVVQDVRSLPTPKYRSKREKFASIIAPLFVPFRVVAASSRLLVASVRLLFDSSTKLVNSGRRFILFMRTHRKVVKKVVDTVEVVKEVPVDKIVFKEVPKEVVIRELVHVPMYTNDLERVNLQGASSKSKNTNGTDEENKKK